MLMKSWEIWIDIFHFSKSLGAKNVPVMETGVKSGKYEIGSKTSQS